MKNKILLTIILIFSLFVSCKKGEKELEKEYVATIVDKVNTSNNTKWIVILPGMGCHGCIQEGEYFMKEYIGNPKILFVLTKIESLKILQKKIEVNFKEHSNIYIDSKENFNMPTNNTVYPCIVYLENGKVKSYEFQSPSNAGFENLKARL